MTKAELVEEVTQLGDLTRRDGEVIVDTIFDAVIGALNAAVGAWYYLRIAAVMYLREAVEPLPRLKPAPVLGSIWVCALLTFGLGVWSDPVIKAVDQAVASRGQEAVAKAP